MQATQALVLFAHGQHLQQCPLPATAPFEIHGGRNRGCLPGDDYHFSGHRYLYDTQRDVLIREDVRSWMTSQQ